MAAPDPERGKDDVEMMTYHFNVEEAQSKDGGRPPGRGNSRSGAGGKKPHGVPMALQSGSSWADPENLHRQGHALE